MAGVTVAEGVVVITADGTKVPKQIADDIDRGMPDVDGAGRRSGNGFLAAFGGSALGAGLVSIGVNLANTIGNAIGTGIRSAVDFAIDSIDVASGLNEAATAIDQVFGTGATKINAFAEGAAGKIGQSELAALKAAQSFGVYGRAANLADDANADFSMSLVSLGSDLASFYDTSPEEAIEALGAGLRGEAEPLRRYGILLDDATLKQKALEMGIWDGVGSLSQQQRVLAAQAEILDQASVATGDFERTSDGLANQQRILAAEVENAKGKLGESLLPAMLDLTNFANDELVPMLDDVIDKVGPQLAAGLEEGGPKLVELLEAVGPLLPDLIELGTEVLPVLISAIEAGTPVISTGASAASDWVAVWKDGADFLAGDTTVTQYYENLRNQNQALADQQVVNGATTLGVLGMLEVSTGGVGQAFTNMQGVNTGAMFGLLGVVESTTGGVSSAFNDMTGNISRFEREANANINAFVGGMLALPGKVFGAVQGANNWLYGVGRDIIGGMIRGVDSMIGSAVQSVKNVGGQMLDGVKSFLGIQSPSRVFDEQVGQQIGAGTIRGWRTSMAGFGGEVARTFADVPMGNVAVELGAMSAGRDMMTPYAVAPSATPIQIDVAVTSPDPELAGRQVARGLSERLGI